jgi:predicted transcriptional regulator
MTVIELKEKLIAEINRINDEELLSNILRNVELEQELNEIYILSADEKVAVREGIKQIESGQFYTNDEANTIFNKCLGK